MLSEELDLIELLRKLRLHDFAIKKLIMPDEFEKMAEEAEQKAIDEPEEADPEQAEQEHEMIEMSNNTAVKHEDARPTRKERFDSVEAGFSDEDPKRGRNSDRDRDGDRDRNGDDQKRSKSDKRRDNDRSNS